MNKYTINSSKGCVLEVDLEYPKELQELRSDYPFAPYKIEIKREILSEYQLKISDLYNIPIGNVKKKFLTFLIKRSMCLYNLQLYLRLGLKLEKIRQVLELNQTHTHTRTHTHTYIYIYIYILYIIYILYYIYILNLPHKKE